jgi:hypothetical protein
MTYMQKVNSELLEWFDQKTVHRGDVFSVVVCHAWSQT